MIKIKGLDHLVLRVDNMEEMLAFYTGVLGCAVERETDPEVGLIQLRAGSALIDLVNVNSRLGRLGGGSPIPEGRNLDHFCLRIEPFDEQQIRDHLKMHDITGSELADRYGAEGEGPSIYIQDPEGNTVELKGPAY